MHALTIHLFDSSTLCQMIENLEMASKVQDVEPIQVGVANGINAFENKKGKVGLRKKSHYIMFFVSLI